MNFGRSLVLAALALHAPICAADEVTVVAPAKETVSNWLEATTSHFVVVAQMDEGQLRKRAARLERLHALLSLIAPARSDNKLLIYMTDGIDPIQRMAHMNNIAGYYVPTAMGAFAVSPKFVQNAGSGWTPEVILFHEYTHHMLLQSNDEYFPGWATEGLAELFATTRIKDTGEIEVGVANQARARDMFAMNRWSMEKLLRSDAIKIDEAETIEKYTRGALLVHYLLMDKQRAPQFSKFISAINRGTEPVEAGRQAFGDLGAMDRALDAYRRQARVPSVVYKPEQFTLDSSVTVRNLAVDEAAALPLVLESESDEDRKHTADLVPSARRIGARYPNSAVVQQAVGQVEYEAGSFAEAAVAVDRALAIDPANVMALLYKGRLLGQKALTSKSQADWSAARAQFIRANRINPNHPWPFILLYDSYAAAGQEPSAGSLTGLRRAVVLAPQDEGVRVRMALQQIRENDLAGASMMIAPVAFSPHGKADAPAAKFYPILAAGGETSALLAKAVEIKLPVNSFFPKKPEEKKNGAARADR